MADQTSRLAWAVAATILLVPLPAAAPAAAEDAHTYRGMLTMTGAGPRYVAVDAATGETVFTSASPAVDGTLDPNSADGLTVAYVSTETTSAGDVDRLHVAGTGRDDRVVYTGALDRVVSEPVVAADSSAIAFVVDSDTSSALMTVDLRSGAVRVVQSSAYILMYGPSYSPDARYLCWAQDTDNGNDMVVAHADGTEPGLIYHISPQPWGFDDTAWNNDGTEIVGAMYDDNPQYNYESLYLFSSRGQQKKILVEGTQDSSGTTTSYLEPTWAPDRSGVYASKVVATAAGDEQGSLVFITRDGAISDVPAPAYLGSPAASGPPPPADNTPPAAPDRGYSPQSKDHVRVGWGLPPDSGEISDVVVTRVVGAAADTPTADNIVATVHNYEADIVLPKPDTDYGISLFSRDWAGNLSTATKIQVRSNPGTTVSLTAPARVNDGATVYLHGRVDHNWGNELVSLYARAAGTKTPVFQYSKRTDGDGSFTFLRSPHVSTEYTVRYEGDDAHFPATSAKRIVTVAPVVTMALSTNRIRHGHPLTVSGSVKPTHAGQIVRVQRYLGGTWRTIASARLSSTGTYRYALTPATAGTWKVRVVKPADMEHVEAYSAARLLYVS